VFQPQDFDILYIQSLERLTKIDFLFALWLSISLKIQSVKVSNIFFIPLEFLNVKLLVSANFVKTFSIKKVFDPVIFQSKNNLVKNGAYDSIFFTIFSDKLSNVLLGISKESITVNNHNTESTSNASKLVLSILIFLFDINHTSQPDIRLRNLRLIFILFFSKNC
jgi:hypothetical protein